MIEILENSFFQVLITAIVSYIVAKVQANSNSKNIDKQIQAEIKKIEKEHTYALERDNQNYLNKIMLEKSFEVHEQIANFCRKNMLLNDTILEILEDTELNNDSKAKQIINSVRHYIKKNEWSHVDANLNMVYMPGLETDWKEVYALTNLLKDYYYGEIIKGLKSKSEPFETKQLEFMIEELHGLSNKLLSDIRDEIRNSIIKLSK